MKKSMNPVKSLETYIRSSIAELKKVTWPSRQETMRYTVLVTAVSVIVAAFFASLDFGLGKIVDATLIRRGGAGTNTPAAAPAVTPDLEPLDTDNGVTVEADPSQEFVPTDIETSAGSEAPGLDMTLPENAE